MRKPKPPISDWIARERKARGWKVEELSRRLVEMGYQAEVKTVQVWEASRSPRPETIEALERLFGSQAPREQADTSDLTAAVRELVEEVRLSRLVSERSAEVLAGLLGLLLEERQPREGTQAEADAHAGPGTR